MDNALTANGGMSGYVSETKPKKTNRVNTGEATNDLVHSAYQDTNDGVFLHILHLYAPEGTKIADITYGKGVFWKNVG